MKKFSIFYFVFSFIGAALLAGAIYLYISKKAFLEKAETVQGTVTEMIPKRSDGSTTYSPVVLFKTKSGQEITYTSSASSNPPSYHVGEKVDMFYDPADPSDAEINGFFSLWLGALILGFIGFVFFLIGSLAILFSYLKRKKTQNLCETGKSISTKFMQVHLNTSYTVNGRNPFQISTQWQDPQTNEIYVFNSENIWFDPTEYVNVETVRVLIDPQNPKEYVMDISFLPRMGN